jgi:ubiquinone/menaquinone biosynthesis C-methylase UbiE
MITRSEGYVEYCRETARRLHDVQDLALRGKNKQQVTRKILERVVQAVDLRPDDVLLDIGCGDGTLLQMAPNIGVHNATGLLATEEEGAVLRRLGLQVRQGFPDQLPLDDESASVVICNNVLLVVSKEKISPSLREIYRVARPGARIYVGEIPLEPGPPPEPEFATARQTLAYLYRSMACEPHLACCGEWPTGNLRANL